MIRQVVSFALHQPLFTILLAVLFVTGGVVAFRQLPIEAFPDVSDVQVIVISLFPGHAAEEVEKQVTIPLETELSGLAHSVRMFSHTQFGLSFIMMTFDDGATDYFARAQVLEHLQGVNLPLGVQPQLAPLTTPIGEIYRYRIKSDSLDARELRSIQDWVVERQLKMVPGIADVVSFGGFIKQYQVAVDLGRLKSYNITLQDAFTALGKGNSNAGIVAVVIPLALLATFIGLEVRGIPANLLSLGAMDFGIIVDGAVIVVENIFRRLSRDRVDGSASSTRAAVLEATVQVGRPTFFSMLIIIVAHIPIFTLQRQEGRIFAPMAYTVTSALVGSLLFSLTLVPLLCLYLLRKRLPHKETFIVRASKRLYEPVLAWAVAHKKIVIASAVIALTAGLFSSSLLGSEFLPELNEGTIWINVMLPPSISLTEAQKACARIRALVRETPEVRTVVSKTGRPEDGTDPKLINMAELFVDLKPRDEWTRKVTKEQILKEMDQRLDTIPGIDTSFSQPIRDNILESISQIDGQIVVKVFGADIEILHAKAQEVIGKISSVRGVSRAFIDRAGMIPQLRIDIDRERAARYGLNVDDIQDVIETAIGGKAATEIWEGEKRFAVVVRLREEYRRDAATIGKIVVDAPSGARVPLEDLSTISVHSGQANIAREMGTRLAAIGVFIRGRDMGSVVADAQRAVREKVKLPDGYYMTWGGEFENQERAMARLKVIVPISVFLIFLLLFNAFKSVKHAVLILLNVPFAVIGGVFALLLTGTPLSVSAAVGFIALFGQAVLNGVVMVTYFNQLRERGLPVRDAVRQGALVRLRTVLMTALLASLGLLPAALSTGIGSETQKPLAIVIIGGLISATMLTLIVLPTLYLVFNSDRTPEGEEHNRSKEAIAGEHQLQHTEPI